jgi:tRNA threonylcarbamoyladenosine modification (KEOPS) complex Cgi121 subunit
MIVKEFLIENIKLNYYVGISQIKLEAKNIQLEMFFNLIKEIQSNFKNAYLQFFNDTYVLNTQHIYLACYFVQRAFYYKKHISNKKEIEILLYLAANRQIKHAIRDFGIDDKQIKKGIINYCIVSSINNINKVENYVNTSLKASERKFTLNDQKIEKYHTIRNYFGFSDYQIETILNSYNIKKNIELPNQNNLSDLYLALNDLICEQMALISLE